MSNECRSILLLLLSPANFRALILLTGLLLIIPLPANAQSMFAPQENAAGTSPFKPSSNDDENKADGGNSGAASAPAPAPVRRIEPRGGGGNASILVDAQGNKTLVVRGDSGPPQVMVNSPDGHQTQVIFGDDTAGLIMDKDGHKTLVVRGDAVERSAAAPRQALERRRGYEKPYWLVDAPEEQVPYFKVTEQKNDVPYWLEPVVKDSVPYWAMEEEKHTRPYWLPEAEYVEIVASEMQLEPLEVASAAPIASASPLAGGKKVISYYMYQDEQGVKHVTNIPNDPRYRRFTAVVQVQVGRGGLGRGGSLRFTHETLRPVIMKAAAVYGLDPALIAAVIRSESAFDAKAVSWAGAQGLMQLMPATARDMGVYDAFDPEQNVMGGSRYLRKMLDEFNGDLTLALAAYNAGPNRVKRNWKVPNIAETQNYVVIVRRNYERYQSQF